LVVSSTQRAARRIRRQQWPIEAVEIDIAAKTAGRVREILVNEGDFVRAALSS
jgi:multidrug efflux pump subunit AcrA (membrane-fusion protein)